MKSHPTQLRLMMIGGLILAVFGIGFLFTMREVAAPTPPPTDPDRGAGIQLLTTRDTYSVGEEFTLELRVHSTVPANTYAASLQFPGDTLTAGAIIDNPSVVDLWIEEPRVTSAGNSVFFAGGSLRPNGFTGEETILQVTFTGTTPGEATLTVADLQILAHDGHGSEIPLTTTTPLTLTISD